MLKSGAALGTAVEGQQKRKSRLTSILTQGLPALPTVIFELNSLLSSPVVDLKKVSKIIRSDPSLSANVLRLCNSALFCVRRQVVGISDAAVLLGTERLRTLVLTCSVIEFTGRQLSAAAVQAFWRHSFLTALLSERIAQWTDYFEKEQAYLGGLLHDIGWLPLWIVLQEEQARGGPLPPPNWQDNRVLEREYFGMDHCEAGRRMGLSWNLFPSFIDVFEHHHSPSAASRDPQLVGIVAGADHFCQTHGEFGSADPAHPQGEFSHFLQACLPRLFAEDRAALEELLENEYLHVLPIIELDTLLSSGSGPSQKSRSQGEGET